MTNGDDDVPTPGSDPPAGECPELEEENPDISRLRIDLLDSLQKLCDVYRFAKWGKNMTSSAAGLLASSDCERRIKFHLEHLDLKDGTKFDPYYAEKSRYATTFILDHLKNTLEEVGLEYLISNEVRVDLGIHDVVILAGPARTEKRDNAVLLRFEIKGSAGISLEQIARYIASDSSPLVLVRVAFNQVAILKDSASMKAFVQMMIHSLVTKAARLEEGKIIIVPGRECHDCPDASCSYNKRANKSRGKTVTIEGGEFQKDVVSFFENLPTIAEKVRLVTLNEIVELGGSA